MILSEEDILLSFRKFYQASPVQDNQCMDARWPGAFPLMRMSSRKYRLREFGSLLVVQIKAPHRKEMLCSFTPWEGNDVPYLMIELVVTRDQDSAVLSYYDHTGKNPDMKRLQNLAKRYHEVSDLPLEGKWHEKDRAAYSLAKAGDPSLLKQMVMQSIGIYAGSSYAAGKDPRNLKGLKNLRRKIKDEGMPFTQSMEKMLGKDGYVEFLYKNLIPVNERGE